MTNLPFLKSIKIQGYRPFRDALLRFGKLEVIVGANGSGKSSLFEFLKFLRDSVYQDIPPEIIAGSANQQIFHVPGPDRFWWSIEVDFFQKQPIFYQGQLEGSVGKTKVSFERVGTNPINGNGNHSYLFMNVKNGQGLIQDPVSKKLQKQEISLKRPNQLALSTATNPNLVTLYNLREYIEGWRFYSSFNIANNEIRKPVFTEQNPVLREDAANLSAVLFYLMSYHRPLFDELQQHLHSVVPGFKGLSVKPVGRRGEVMAFWSEGSIDDKLTLADVSDGILRLICWMVLCLNPEPSPLICIDEPDQGVHPRTLPVLAGLFEKASQRTQILLATHASYFLTQFDISNIAVMRKENSEAKFLKPADSATLRRMLEDFGSTEIEILHRSDELELLA
jgi:predicted ATPase